MSNYELRVKNIIDKYNDLILSNKNIVGVGLGNKNINGRITDIPCLKFLVAEKISPSALSSESFIPKKFYGVLTDVVEITTHEKNNVYENSKMRIAGDDLIKPVKGGVLIKNTSRDYDGGTLGYVVYGSNATKGRPGQKYMLSSARVLTGNFKGDKEDEISQIAEIKSKDTVKQEKLGKLKQWSDEIKLYEENEVVIGNKIIRNETDSAIAIPTSAASGFLEQGVLSDKTITGSTDKVGKDSEFLIVTRTSGEVKGVLESSGAVVTSMYDNKKAYFKNQIVLKIKAQQADYGAVGLVNMNGSYKIFGLLIGHLKSIDPKGTSSSERVSSYAIFTPISVVIKRMGIKFLEDLL